MTTPRHDSAPTTPATATPAEDLGDLWQALDSLPQVEAPDELLATTIEMVAVQAGGSARRTNSRGHRVAGRRWELWQWLAPAVTVLAAIAAGFWLGQATAVAPPQRSQSGADWRARQETGTQDRLRREQQLKERLQQDPEARRRLRDTLRELDKPPGSSRPPLPGDFRGPPPKQPNRFRPQQNGQPAPPGPGMKGWPQKKFPEPPAERGGRPPGPPATAPQGEPAPSPPSPPAV